MSGKNVLHHYLLIALAIVGAGGLVGLGVFFGTRSAPPSGSAPAAQVAGEQVAPSATELEITKLSEDDHLKGSSEAPVVLIEYSDIECPFCQRFHPTLQQAVDEYPDQVAWVFRHFPLGIHANAQKEAEATECASAQGGNEAFWRYLDTLFERTQGGGTGFALDDLAPLAEELGLDKEQFEQCLGSGQFEKEVRDELDAGAAAGIQGTPGTFVVNRESNEVKFISGLVSFEQLKELIEEML